MIKANGRLSTICQTSVIVSIFLSTMCHKSKICNLPYAIYHPSLSHHGLQVLCAGAPVRQVRLPGADERAVDVLLHKRDAGGGDGRLGALRQGLPPDHVPEGLPDGQVQEQPTGSSLSP